VQEPGKEIDDTDGKEPEEEFEAWRMRELMRLKRDKEAERQREEERLEIERRRAMPEEQRLKEDLERAQKLREEKPKGNGVFLQKYWHKGAFYQVGFNAIIPLEAANSIRLGYGRTEETRPFWGCRISSGRITSAENHASQELWKEKQDKIHALEGPGYNYVSTGERWCKIDNWSR
jgi:Microfibril-associated/Pre-mRNA processing